MEDLEVRRVVTFVEDRYVESGRGIVPRPDSPGLGLGLPLIATLAESLELGTGRSEETEVRMTFRYERDLDRAKAELSARGVRFGHEGDVAGYARFASFADPDGNTVQLIEYGSPQAESAPAGR